MTVEADGQTSGSAVDLEGHLSSVDRLSPEIVRQLYEVHGRELLAFLTGVLRDVTAASDVAQITYRRLLEVGHQAQGETIKGWMFTVAMREALDYRRRDGRRERHLREYAIQCEALPLIAEFVDDLSRGEDVAALRAAVARLPLDQQQVIRQRIYDDKTFATIAAESGLPLGTVLTRMRLALGKLRSWLSSK